MKLLTLLVLAGALISEVPVVSNTSITHDPQQATGLDASEQARDWQLPPGMAKPGGPPADHSPPIGPDDTSRSDPVLNDELNTYGASLYSSVARTPASWLTLTTGFLPTPEREDTYEKCGGLTATYIRRRHPYNVIPRYIMASPVGRSQATRALIFY
ncbi:Uu.00g045170.m01.CDS01, partial [Anthostomella pinea]